MIASGCPAARPPKVVNPGASPPATQVRLQTARVSFAHVLHACTVRACARAPRASGEARQSSDTMLRMCDPPLGASKRERALPPKKRSTKGAKAATSTRGSCRPKHNHSKIATDLFKDWFYANLRHPFPSDEVKAEFADRTGERASQVSGVTGSRMDAKRADAALPIDLTTTFREFSASLGHTLCALVGSCTRSCIYMIR